MDTVTAAILGFLFSILSFLLATGYKVFDDDRKRKWQIEDDEKRRQRELEDRKAERRFAVLSIRLQEVITLINQIFDLARMMASAEEKLIRNKKKEEFLLLMNEVSVSLDALYKSASNITHLSDKELNESTLSLLEIINKEASTAKILLDNIENKKEIDIKVENNRVANFMKDFSIAKNKVVKRVDELSGFDT